MRSLYISLFSEFYKSRKTLAFWASILLPFIVCGFISFGFYSNSEKILSLHYPAKILWLRYISASMGVMGVLILPFYIIFIAFSVNNIEHKNDTWKMLFAQPLNKFSIYTAKYLYALILVFICLALFGLFTLGFGYLLQHLVPRYNLNRYNPLPLLKIFYTQLFFASLGILSIQLILSLLWSDFLKPMGIGFVGTIIGIITANVSWKYTYLIVYSQPTLVLNGSNVVKKISNPAEIPVFSQEILTSICFAVVFFVGGYFIVARRSVK